MVAQLGVRVGAKSKASTPSLQLKAEPQQVEPSSNPWFIGTGNTAGEQSDLSYTGYEEGSAVIFPPGYYAGIFPQHHGMWQVTFGWSVEVVGNIFLAFRAFGFDFPEIHQEYSLSAGDGSYFERNQITGSFIAGPKNPVEGYLAGATAGTAIWTAGHLIAEMEPPGEA